MLPSWLKIDVIYLMHALTKDVVTKKLTEKFIASFTHVDINLLSDIHIPNHKKL